MKENKMTLTHLVSLRISFFDSHPVECPLGRTGMRYLLTKGLTQEQEEEVSKFSNVVISEAQHRYVPELKYLSIIILN